MADKTVADLPALQAVSDETLIPVYQPGAANPAQKMKGQIFRQWAEASVTPYSAAARADAVLAENAKAGAQSALSGVQTAIKNIPPGATPIVNDLTTGGVSMALSAEQGRVLRQIISALTAADVRALPAAGGTLSAGVGVGGGYGRLEATAQLVDLYSLNTQDNYGAYRAIRVINSSAADMASAAMLLDNGTGYKLYHEGNKPIGSYTGNGVARTVACGGLGRAVLIFSGWGIGVVTATGGVFISPSGVSHFAQSVLRFGYTANDGILNILGDAANALFNGSGQTYNYQVL